MATFIDTNVLLHHIAGDHAIQSPAARQLIADVEYGKTSIWTSDLVIAEVVWVLSSKVLYSMTRAEIQDSLLPIVELQSLQLDGKRLYRRVFEIYVSANVNFIDAFHAAMIEQQEPPHLYSFDRDYDRIPTVKRIEPQIERNGPKH